MHNRNDCNDSNLQTHEKIRLNFTECFVFLLASKIKHSEAPEVTFLHPCCGVVGFAETHSAKGPATSMRVVGKGCSCSQS